MASLAMLFSWEILKEQNTRVFQNKYSTSPIMLEKIKTEARLWFLARAKALSIIMLRE
jgi:hypothetical protein